MKAQDLKTEIRSARLEFAPHTLAVPLVLSSGTIERIVEARAEVAVRLDDGREAAGRGAMLLSVPWAWPDNSLSPEFRDEQLQSLCRTLEAELIDRCGPAAHPLELGLALAESLHEQDLPCPPLAALMCASPFDAAIHDAAGRAAGVSAFRFYDSPCELPRAEGHLGPEAWRTIRQALRSEVRSSLPAWWLVNHNDGPEVIRRAYQRGGYRCYKIKIHGRDAEVDAKQTALVYRAAIEAGAAEPTLTVDSNEGHANASEVAAYLDALQALDAEAYGALAYLEQPTSRDILNTPIDFSAVSARKPVLADECLTSLSLLPEISRLGYAGLALKTCKGHSGLLVAAAWAKAREMPIALQDLTNPGIALIHAAWVGAHLETINGCELNSPQFLPDANTEFARRDPGLFRPEDGVHRLGETPPVGLGGMD